MTSIASPCYCDVVDGLLGQVATRQGALTCQKLPGRAQMSCRLMLSILRFLLEDMGQAGPHCA